MEKSRRGKICKGLKGTHIISGNKLQEQCCLHFQILNFWRPIGTDITSVITRKPVELYAEQKCHTVTEEM